MHVAHRFNLIYKVSKESIQSSTTPDPEHHMESDKTQENITYKRANRLALSQQVNTRLQWTDKKAWQTRNINNKNDPQRIIALERSVKIFLLGGLN